MSYSTKTKGWRRLILDNHQFRWRFVPKAENSLLKLQGSASSGQQAIIILREWGDPWFFIGQTDGLPNKPEIITTKFAGQAIAFALQNGWKPEEAGLTIYFEFKDGYYSRHWQNQ